MYQLQCGANVGSVKREYFTLYLDDRDSMLDHIKTTRRLLKELFKYVVVVSEDEKKMNFIQSLGSSWNGYVGALEASSKFESMLGHAQAEHLRREQQDMRSAARKIQGAVEAGVAFVAASMKKKNPTSAATIVKDVDTLLPNARTLKQTPR